MFDYLQKFNNLPKSLRDKVSSPEVMRAIFDLENKYLVDLAAVIMKIMTKTLLINDLVDYFVTEFSLTKEKAEALKLDIIKSIFYLVKDYLELEPSKKDAAIDNFFALLIKEANLSLPSEDLYLRLKNIAITYLKGVRNVLDTKNSLMKKVEFGGLNLSLDEADRVLKIIKSQGLVEKNSPATDVTEPNLNKKEEIKGVVKEELELQVDPVKEEINRILYNENRSDDQALAPSDGKNSKEKLDKIIMEAEAAAPLFIKKTVNTDQAINVRDEAKMVGSALLLSKPESALLFKDNKQALLPAVDQKKLLSESKVGSKEEAGIKPQQVPDIKNDTEKESIIKTDLDLNKKLEAPTVVNDDKPELEVNKKEVIKETLQKDDVAVKQENKEDPRKKLNNVSPAIKTNINFNRPAPISSKRRMDDIKPIVKIMSPIDELKFLDLINFRRLGENVNEIILKIFNKIKLLEKDGYDKMILGVKAWRQSEVNRLYVKMGQAIMRGISLKELIDDRKKNNQPCLKIEEINAISHLNSRLSF